MRHHAPTRALVPPDQYVLVFDGECGFCTRFAQRMQRWSRSPLTLMPFGELPPDRWLTTLTDAQIRASSHFITPEGREYHGGESVTRALRLVRGGWLASVLDLPGLSWVREIAYAWVAGNRALLSRSHRN